MANLVDDLAFDLECLAQVKYKMAKMRGSLRLGVNHPLSLSKYNVDSAR